MNNLNQACEQDDLLIVAHLSSDSLPKLLKDCIAMGHTPEEQDIILLSVLTAASSVMPNYYFRTALLITSKLLLHAADAYNQIEGQKQQAVPERKGSYQKQMLLQSLPEEFETGLCVAESEKIGIHERTARRWIEYWTGEGLIRKLSHGLYRKVA